MNLKNDSEWNRRLRKSSHSQMIFKIGFLKNFAIFTRKNLSWCLFLIKFNKLFKKRDSNTGVYKWILQNSLRTAFFIDYLRWLLLVTAINRRYSEEYTLQNSKENMLRNSDKMDYALQIQQKSTVGVFCEILEQLLSIIIFRGCFWKEKRGRGRCEVTLAISGFYFFQDIHLLSHENLLSPEIFA